MSDDYKPRFSFEITEEQQSRVNKAFGTYGIRKAVFSVILDDLLDMVEQHGQVVVGILLDRATKPRTIVPSMAEAERRSK
jgi:hypothetical protein